MVAFSKEMVSFIEVARQGSMRRAAALLNVSASSLSRQMTILENSFGVKLLIRLPSGIRLTAAGKAAYAKALIWHEDQEQLLFSLQHQKQNTLEPIRLGLVACFAAHFVPELQNRLERQGMNVPLEIQVDTTDGLVESLNDHRVDAIVAFNVVPSETLRFYFEQDHPLGLVHAPDFSVGGEPSVSVEQCLDYPLCLPDNTLSYHTRLVSELARQKLAPDVVLKSNSVALIKNFVVNGKGVTFLTELDVQWEIERGELVYTPVNNNKRLVEQLCIAISNGKELTARDRVFLDILVQVVTRDFRPPAEREGTL